jgi:hypothetical protein
VDGSVAHLADHTAPLGKLNAQHGVYLVTGNHQLGVVSNCYRTETLMGRCR